MPGPVDPPRLAPSYDEVDVRFPCAYGCKCVTDFCRQCGACSCDECIPHSADCLNGKTRIEAEPLSRPVNDEEESDSGGKSS